MVPPAKVVLVVANETPELIFKGSLELLPLPSVMALSDAMLLVTVTVWPVPLIKALLVVPLGPPVGAVGVQSAVVFQVPVVAFQV